MLSYAIKHNLEYTVPSHSENQHWNPVYALHLVNPNYNPNIEKIHLWEGQHNYEPLPFDESWRDKNIVIEGYRQTEKYFVEYRDEILYLLDFPYIKKEGYVGIHCRFGDYKELRMKHPEVTKEYYQKAMDMFPDYKLKVFSDEIEEAKKLLEGVEGLEWSTNTSEVDDVVELSCCQPAGTKIQTPSGQVSIENISIGDWVLSYSQTTSNKKIIGREKIKNAPPGRRVIDKKDRLFCGELVVVSTKIKTTKYTPDHECIVMMGDCFKGQHLVYLMQKGNKFRVGVTKPSSYRRGRKNNESIGRSDVRNRVNSEKADACWVLCSFDNMYDALMEEQYVSSKFGIPEIRFVGHPLKIQEQIRINKFWDRYGDNIQSGKRCLEFYKREINYPFISSKVQHLTQNSEVKMRACNLMDGMKVLDFDLYIKYGGKGVCHSAWDVINITHEQHNGLVYSMTVDKNHTYIGDGIITHNCEHQICSPSTFSWAAMWMNRNPNKVVIFPDFWFTPNWNNTNVEDIVPEWCIKLSI